MGLEGYELSVFCKFDDVMLITGDSDHEMLICKLKTLNIHVVLLMRDVGSDSSASSKLLKDEICMHIELREEVAIDRELFLTAVLRITGR